MMFFEIYKLWYVHQTYSDQPFIFFLYLFYSMIYLNFCWFICASLKPLNIYFALQCFTITTNKCFRTAGCFTSAIFDLQCKSECNTYCLEYRYTISCLFGHASLHIVIYWILTYHRNAFCVTPIIHWIIMHNGCHKI
jgi:hypothetical protein